MTKTTKNIIDSRVRKICISTRDRMYTKMQNADYAEGFIEEVCCILKSDYKKDGGNYAVFLYCKTLLMFRKLLNLKTKTIALLENKKDNAKSKIKDAELFISLEITDLML